MSDIVESIVSHQEYFRSGATKSFDFRYTKLDLLEKSIQKNEIKIADALYKDLGKSAFESYETETGIVLAEIREAKKGLKRWMRPRKVKTPFSCFPAKSFVYKEPFGVSLIMSTWNYPFQLTMAPLVGAISAGNSAVLKPSNYAAHTADIINDIVVDCFEKEYVSVVLGGREANQDLLNQEFDYIFFTGGIAVGTLVMESASKYLTPVTLELGGKSPCIVDETANLELAAKRIAWGKCINAGQTCIAPDYLLVQECVKDRLIDAIERNISTFFDDSPLDSPIYPKIINERHFDRLVNLMESGGTIRTGGRCDRNTLKIEPTLIDGVTFDSPVMKEEIFGPLFPVITFENIEHAADIVNSHPKPLALYYFTTDKAREAYVLEHVAFGGGCVNDTLMHFVSPMLPFGGVGMSGMGKYHGKYSFDTFSHEKGVMKRGNAIDLPIRYPPYVKEKEKTLRRFL